MILKDLIELLKKIETAHGGELKVCVEDGSGPTDLENLVTDWKAQRIVLQGE
jgi:hypothetical protein